MSNLQELNYFQIGFNPLLKAALTIFKKAKGVIPDKGYFIKNIGIDHQQYGKFCRMFEFDSSTVPSVYWYVRLFKLQTLLMADKEAPLPMPGMVQLYLHIDQYETIYPADKLDATIRFGRLIQHDKGTIIETIMTLYKEDKKVWEQKNYNLYIGKKRFGDPIEEKVEIDIDKSDEEKVWKLVSKNAIDFAKVSGDFNPIHLNKLFGKLFGFPGQLAHGWFSLSKAYSSMQSDIPLQHEIYAAFKKPLVLPNTVIFRRQNTDDRFVFDIINQREAYPHLKGFIKKL